MPSCLTIERWTSASVTFSITWSRPRTAIELTTLSEPPTRRAARSAACCASIGFAAVPDSTTPSPTPSMWMSEFGSDLLQRGAHAIEVAGDGDVIGRDLLARRIKEHDVGLADGCADDIGALGGADDGVGDLRIGNQHILDVARQVEHDGFADPERNRSAHSSAHRRRSRPEGRARRDSRSPPPASGPG